MPEISLVQHYKMHAWNLRLVSVCRIAFDSLNFEKLNFAGNIDAEADECQTAWQGFIDWGMINQRRT